MSDDDDIENLIETRPVVQHAANRSNTAGSGSDERTSLLADQSGAEPRLAQAPAFILHMSPEERRDFESRLKRKIDLRLMPAIIVMYILNYIDRSVFPVQVP